VNDQVSHPYKTTVKIVVLHILVFNNFKSLKRIYYVNLKMASV